MDAEYEVYVRWSKDYISEDLYFYKDNITEVFYMILCKRKKRNLDKCDYKICYIGQSPKRKIYNRVIYDTKHAYYKIKKDMHGKRKVVIRIGKISKLKGDCTLVLTVVSDVESTLIQRVIPPYNKMGKSSYHGRIIKIINSGNYKPLPRTVDVSKW